MAIGDILKDLRKSENLTQSELASKLQIGQSTIVGYEKNLYEPSITNLSKYARYFNVSLDSFFDSTDLISPKDKAQGASNFRKISISPAEDELIYMFREAGKKYGSAAQQTILDMVQGILKL